MPLTALTSNIQLHPASVNALDMHPELMGLARLMTNAYQDVNMDHTAIELLARCQDNHSEDANALLDLNILLQLRGDTATALALQKEALQITKNFHLKPDNKQTPLRLLAFMAEGDLLTNTPFEFLALGAGMDLHLLYIDEKGELPKNIPEHDIAIVAVCELDRNQKILASIDKIIQHWPCPVLNAPQRILKMTRDLNGAALQHKKGINMPITLRLQRCDLQKITHQGLAVSDILFSQDYPIIIRPIDSHAGKGLEKIDSTDQLKSYLERHLDEHFFVSSFANYANSEGMFCKYRVVMMNGEAFLIHTAISEHWMVHYLNAGMMESHDKRQVEAKAMATFDQGFAKKHAKALTLIHRHIGTDYFGIDCAETAEGELLVFEVGTSMLVHDMDSRTLFPYKKAQMKKVFTAFRQFIIHAYEDAQQEKTSKEPSLIGH